VNIVLVHVNEEAALARAVKAQLHACFGQQVGVTLSGEPPIGVDHLRWCTQALSDAEMILLLMSRASYARSEISMGGGYAIHAEKKVIPLLTRDMPPELVDPNYRRYREVVVDDPEGVGRLIDTIAASTAAGRLIPKRAQAVAAWLRAVRSASPASAAPPDPREVRRLLTMHYAAYGAGMMAKAFHSIAKAFALDPLKPEVAARYIVMLLRYDRFTEIERLLANLWQTGVYDDRVRMIEGEFLLRQGKYRESRDVLDEIQDKAAYNVLYLRGMTYLLEYGADAQIAAWAKATEVLRQAHAVWGDQWWVTLNLAVALRLGPSPDLVMETLALAQLNAAIVQYPLKASPRMYRLLYFALKQDLAALRVQIEADFADVGGDLELPSDLLNWVQARLDLLLAHDSATRSLFTDEIIRWTNGFRVLTWPPDHAEIA
jgi:tetratricopeptide (TPR) repeat protein